MSKTVSIRLSDSIASELERHALARGLKPSQAARDLIRRGLDVVSTSRDAGFEEGRIEAHQKIMLALQEVLS